VAIARAFGNDTTLAGRVVVLDEPTAALPGDEVARVFRAIRHARQAGAAVILVSHRLEEVLEIADDVVVLRDGRAVDARAVEGLGADDLITSMLGHELERAAGVTVAADVDDTALLQVRDLVGARLRGVSFDVGRGEVLGVAGVVGCGRSELARVLAGVQRPRSGTVQLDGEAKQFADPHAAVVAGIVAVPQNRRRDGVLLEMTVRENLTLGDLGPVSRLGAIRGALERSEARDLIERFDIRPPSLELPLRLLSGGNQQKVAIARAVRLSPKILVLDEPTQGVDVGARSEIAQIVVALKRQGVGIVLATSDEDELLELADRVIVLDRGRLREVLHRQEITRDRLALALSGSPAERIAA
jgi:ribose transport system ATP-binding protein